MAHINPFLLENNHAEKPHSRTVNRSDAGVGTKDRVTASRLARN
jgi:hypothetical protein